MSKDAEKNLKCSYQTVKKTHDYEPPPGLGMRHLQIFTLFLCLMIAYGMRTSMSVAVVAMTTVSSTDITVPIYNWNKKTQDIVMSSFFWGYMLMQIPAGFVAVRFGGKIPIVVAMTLNGIMSLLTPITASLSWQAVCACRVLQGLSQGMIVPSIHTLLGRWVPVSERGRMGSFVYGGVHVGTVLFLGMSGMLAGSSLGWPSIFYITGVMSIAAAVLWFYIGANSPAKHKTMQEAERMYIQKSLNSLSVPKKLPIAPWGQILRSPAVMAICVAHAGETWGQMTLMSEIPAYMSKVMHTNIQKSGFLTALPFVGKWFTMFIFSFASDALVNRGKLSLVQARKLANTIGSWPVMLGLIGLAYIPADLVIVETLLVITVSIFSAQNVGFMINHIDLSPNYSGSLMSLSNSIANGLGVLAPITAGIILTDDTDPALWRQVFFISAAIFFVTNLVYILFCSADVQPWNDPDFGKVPKDAPKEIQLQVIGDKQNKLKDELAVKEENLTLLIES